MTLGNMRSLGVRSLFATCRTSDHETTVNVDAWSPSHPMDPKRNANGYHQKQRQRHRKTNRIRVHLSTSLPALGTKSHRTHSDNVPVPSFGPRMRCGRCGILGATAVPNWIERRLPSEGARWQYSGLQRTGDPRSENHVRGTPGLGAVWAWGPGIRPDGWCVPPQG